MNFALAERFDALDNFHRAIGGFRDHENQFVVGIIEVRERLQIRLKPGSAPLHGQITATRGL